MSRKLATVRIVTDVSLIDGADQIEVATVDSWKVVVRKNEITVGSVVVYFEIDSWIPTTLAPFLTRGKVPRKFNGIDGERLRTVKMMGQISQGLIMKMEDVIKVVPEFGIKELNEGTDVTDILGIMKWEAPSYTGSVLTKGSFPSFIPKTDQERVQNLTKSFDNIKQATWEVTEKYDGSSLTVYYFKHGDEIKEGVCSRNLEVKMETEKEGVINQYWKVVIQDKLLDKLREAGLNIALQGEMVGFKIGPNIYKLTGHNFWLFDIYNIDSGRYYTPSERQEFAKKYEIKHVPILFNEYTFSNTTIEDLLKFAEGKSVLNPETEREGLVFKRVDRIATNVPIDSFKVISNNYLLRTNQ